MKKKFTWFLSIAIILGLLLGAIACAGSTPTQSPTQSTQKPATSAPATSAPAKTYTLKAGGFGNPTYSLSILMEDAHKLIEQRTNGQVKFQWFPKESLVKVTDMYEAIPAGILDIGITSSTYKDAMGLVNLAKSLPFVWDIESFHAHYRDSGSWFEFQQPYWEKLGLHLLSEGFTGYHQLAIRNTPVHKAEDLKGKLIRSPAGLVDALKIFGAEATFITPTESYEAMQRGAVDGYIGSWDQLKSYSIHEVAKYFTKWNIALAGLQMVMSNKLRQEMPADIVKIIDEAYREAEKGQQARLLGELNELEEFIRKAPGVTEVFELPQDEMARWAKMLVPMWDTAKAKVPAAEWEKFMEIRKPLSKA